MGLLSMSRTLALHPKYGQDSSNYQAKQNFTSRYYPLFSEASPLFPSISLTICNVNHPMIVSVIGGGHIFSEFELMNKVPV